MMHPLDFAAIPSFEKRTAQEEKILAALPDSLAAYFAKGGKVQQIPAGLMVEDVIDTKEKRDLKKGRDAISKKMREDGEFRRKAREIEQRRKRAAFENDAYGGNDD